jgi:hypothetical protein
MRFKKIKHGNYKEFDFPTPMYFIAKLVSQFPSVADTLHRMESQWMRKKIENLSVNKPIYITGFARAGTTITLEMLSHHPDIATHRYLHMVLPYAPHWFQNLANHVPLMTKPVERLHKDELLVTRDSPEAVEEIFWQRYFTDTVDELKSSILGSNTKYSRFEEFYKNHLVKLMINQNAIRYAAKNNYNIARLEYLQKLFPDVKFLILVRNPFNHIASLAKQDMVLGELEYNDPRLLDWTKIIGHREFGSAKFCINLDNTKTIQTIRELWKRKQTYAKGWAIYWNAVYSYIHEKLNSNQPLKNASLIVRYEDLCESPGATIDNIINHIQVDKDKFRTIREVYCTRLHKPTYYKTKYSESEQEDIIRITGDTANKFGYTL